MSGLPRTLEAIEAGRRDGLHLGAQLYISRRGAVVADLAVGEDRPGQPLSPDALMPWLSACKPITAVALGQLWEAGLLDLDDPIQRFVPEFAQGGKEGITLRHALTHTGGFRMLDVGWPQLSWDETIAKVCATRREPRWEPGQKAGYHNASSWFVLGEVVRRLSGLPFEHYARERILLPAGMASSWIGMTSEEYRAMAPRLAKSWDTAPPRPPASPSPASADASPSTSAARDLGWDRERFLTRGSPAGGGRGPMRELGRFYEVLLAGGKTGDGRILAPQTVEALTARHRVGMHDHTFKHVMDWGLGFIPDSKQYGDDVPYAYGPHCSRRTFGHSGYRSVTACADAEHGLVVALAFNGLPADDAHEARARATMAAIYVDLGLGTSGEPAAP